MPTVAIMAIGVSTAPTKVDSPVRPSWTDVKSVGWVLVISTLAGLLPDTVDLTASVPHAGLLCASLMWRRSNPELAASAVFILVGAQIVIPDLASVTSSVVLPVILYAVAAYGHRRYRGAPVVAGIALLFTEFWVDRVRVIAEIRSAPMMTPADLRAMTPPVDETLLLASLPAALLVIAYGFGLLRRSRQRWAAAVAEQQRLLRTGREQASRLASSAERSRIAREMHDVVAHSLAVMIAQADGGRYVAASDPAATAQALSTISDTGRSALSEMRRLLEALREGSPESAETLDVEGGIAPQPDIADLGPLIDRFRGAGLIVQFQSQGTATPMPPGLEVTVYRTVQEGLTNVLKHAGPTAVAHVTLTWSSSSLTVEIRDDGPGTEAPITEQDTGHGLLGMRERAAVYGGTLRAGQVPGGGFRVRLLLPLPHRDRRHVDRPAPSAAADAPTPVDVTP